MGGHLRNLSLRAGQRAAACVFIVGASIMLAGCWPEAEPPNIIQAACLENYDADECRCFSGILSVQLSSWGYRTYTNRLNQDVRMTRFDGGIAQSVLRGRDHRVCVDASDICGVPVCQPTLSFEPAPPNSPYSNQQLIRSSGP